MRKIPIVQPRISEKEKEYVLEVLNSGWLVEGKFARALESKFAEFTGAKYAVTVSNGTTGLHLALEALGVPPGSEVITTAFTFIASSNSILFVGGIPIFADVSRSTYNLDPDSVRKMITPNTKAILVVHIFGLPADMKAFKEIAEAHDLLLIEDCAQAHGAKIDGKHVGTFGDIGVFSLYATKNLIAGEGGIVITNNEELADKLNSIKNHGRGKEGGYNHYRIGYNFRMTDIQAAIALAQLERLPESLKLRERNHKILRDLLSDLDDIIRFQEIPKGYTHSNYICAPHLVDDKITPKMVIDELVKHNISARTIYSIPTYKQPAYVNINQTWRWAKFIKYPDYSKVSLPNTEYLATRHFEVPIHAAVSEEEAQYIAETLRKILLELKS
ncbi:MAG: DegT/DnrJ/EryC1/StrS family aminotransferase [Candidatus Asgardarchaeia archaeon]